VLRATERSEAISLNNEGIASSQQTLLAMTETDFVDDSHAFMVLSARKKPAVGWFTVLKRRSISALQIFESTKVFGSMKSV
jgi:hypothetical protein